VSYETRTDLFVTHVMPIRVVATHADKRAPPPARRRATGHGAGGQTTRSRGDPEPVPATPVANSQPANPERPIEFR
jgi:hypothetical protein